MDNINISLTGGIYDNYSLNQLVQGIKIWLEGLPQEERSKVCVSYAGNDTALVNKATEKLSNLCRINLLGFISIEELKKIHQISIANLYIKINRTFHHKTIEILSAGRPIICYPEESDEVMHIARATNISLHSCSTPLEISNALSESINTKSNELGKNKALEELTWNSQAKKLENLFKTILSNSVTDSSS